MAGETLATEAICLAIRPWSRTSHVVAWLTPRGRVVTVVRGAVRPKSFFLGQYDLNYTCDILYYARARGEIHALRDCLAVARRDALRTNWRANALAGHFRALADAYAPPGDEAAAWYVALKAALDALPGAGTPVGRLQALIAFELKVLELSGLKPALEGAEGGFRLRGERILPVSAAVMRCLNAPASEKNPKILLDAARVIGVYYNFHLDYALERRRGVVELIGSA